MSLTIDKQKARKLFPTAPEWWKKELNDEFGADSFNLQYWEELQLFSDCCKRAGTSEEEFLKKYGDREKDSFAYEQKKVITRAINTRRDGTVWVPDWNDSSEKKWWPWFHLASGSGFVVSNYDYDGTLTFVGSRLCFPTKEQSDFAGSTFERIYLDFLL